MKRTEGHTELKQIFETLDIGSEYFWEPLRIARPGAWAGHLTTAFWLVKVLRPLILVELGTHTGNSYAAFCQAISQLELPSRAFAVDTWKGDDQAGLYDENIFQDLEAFNQNHFGRFSRLVRSTFDEARTYFADGSIDLLHIDGLHTYDAVKHDFETWTSATSPSAVVVFHDINVRHDDFGVWRLWRELSEKYPSFEFHHSEGLGILGLGPDQAPALTRLFELGRDSEAASTVRQLFATRGEAFLCRARGLDLEYLVSVHSERAADLDSTRDHLEHLQANLSQIQPELDRLRQVEAATRNESEHVRRVINEAAEYRRAAEALEQQLQTLRKELDSAGERSSTLEAELQAERERLDMSSSLARQQSLTVQRSMLELQSVRQENLAFKREIENQAQALEDCTQDLENHRRELDKYRQELESYKVAYARVAGLLISPRMRSAVPEPLRQPFRAMKRAVRSILHR